MRIAVCCRDALYAEALTSLLTFEGHFDVVVTSLNPKECIGLSKERAAHVLVLDTEQLNEVDLVFVSGARAYADFALVLIGRGSKVAGGDGLCSPEQDGRALIEAVRIAGKASTASPTGSVHEPRRGYGRRFDLSAREFEVASLVATGYSNRKISQTVGLREQSVKNLVSVIMRKLQCENRVQVALRLSATRVPNPE